MDVTVTTTERGWAGHFICAKSCAFRRNTLITCGNIKWIVSTVGAMRYPIDMPQLGIKAGDMMEIGAWRWYETMCFESKYDEYDDIDVSKEISIESPSGIYGKTWQEVIDTYGDYTDNVANDMHDKVVEEMKIKIKEAYINAQTSGSVQGTNN